MKRALLLCFLLFSCAPAPVPVTGPPTAPIPPATGPRPISWVQLGEGGAMEVRAVVDGADCPAIALGAARLPMTLRAPAGDGFAQLCAAILPPGTQEAALNGQPLPLPKAMPQRILVLGDTGCRLKGDILQACNDSKAWPFAGLSAAAARMKPDLVIDVGDYLYRESACPPGNAGCAGSPHGDNWPAWWADFFSPTAPLLAAAPWVLARGNHEDCDREGRGWLRLLGPLPSGGPCAAHLAPYRVSLGDFDLVVMDDADADDLKVDPQETPVYAGELNGLAAGTRPTWLLMHRPVWGVISGPLGVPVGGNAQLIAAAAGKPPIPPPVELVISGHIHAFEAINYNGGPPPQIVAGHGGDNLDITPANLKGTIFQGSSGVTVKDGLSVGGFGFLMLTRQGDGGWAIQLYDSGGNPERACRFTRGHPGRLDCSAG